MEPELAPPLWPEVLPCPIGVNAPHPVIMIAAATAATILMAQRRVTVPYRRVAG